MVKLIAGFRTTDRHTLHTVNLVSEVQMVSTRKVVVVLFVIECPILRIRYGRCGSHIRFDLLRVIEHFQLHRLMMSLFSHVVRTVIVLVPVLIVGTTHKRRVMRKRHDCIVFANQQFASFFYARRFRDLQDIGNRLRSDSFFIPIRRQLLLKNRIMNVQRNAELSRR